MLLTGKKILVTGGSRGIGRAICLRLAKEGADVYINYLKNHEAANNVKNEIEQMGRKASLIKGNLNNSTEIDLIFDQIRGSAKSLDVLVHCAALGTFRPLHEITAAAWDLTMNVNTKAFFLCTKKALPLMANREGIIIAISSIGSNRYVKDYGAIGVSKAALEALVRYLAVELACYGIRVNGVSAGPVNTDALQSHPSFPKMKEECIARTPARRIGEPVDVANVVAFLCSRESHWICGQTIVADGGFSLTTSSLVNG